VLWGAAHFIRDDVPKQALKVFEDWWPTTLPSIGKSLGSAVAEDDAPT